MIQYHELDYVQRKVTQRVGIDLSVFRVDLNLLLITLGKRQRYL